MEEKPSESPQDNLDKDSSEKKDSDNEKIETPQKDSNEVKDFDFTVSPNRNILQSISMKSDPFIKFHNEDSSVHQLEERFYSYQQNQNVILHGFRNKN